MKKMLFSGAVALFSMLTQAQQKEGKITYERVAQMQMRIADGNDEMERMIPKSRTDKFELSFANNQSLWKQAEKENEDDDNISSGGMHIRMIVAGSDDVLYNNFDSRKKVELRVMFDKKFIVEDSIRPLKWKMGEETKTILNHVCRKATTVNYSKRTTMNVDNGKMERKEIEDTANITAWFTTDIPVSSGPAEYQGQLPGAILAMDINNGRQVFKAIDISEKADVASIKEPQGKKRYTPEEFKKERDKMMAEMEKNNQGGGNRQIRIN
jgi:GLPGLI family protein